MEALQMSLPLMPADINELYIDQCKPDVDGDIFSYLTPHGIREIDTMFCWRIQKLDRDQEEVRRQLRSSRLNELRMWRKERFKTRYGVFRRNSVPDTWDISEKLTYVGEGAVAIRKDILDNPHLHACIKENLIDNLDRVVSEKAHELV
jgi:hypothetical protein